MKNKRPTLIPLILASCIVFGGAIPGYSQPTTVAPSPTLPQGHVISLYNSSGTYTNIAGVNYYEDWGGWSIGQDYSIPPTVLAYYYVSYGGIGFEANPQDVAGCTNLHMDVFTPNGNCFALRMVDTSGHTADIIYTTAGGVITSGSWIGLNMEMSQFTAINPALNLASIQQLGLIANDGGETAGADYYLDNIYFSAATNLVAPPPVPTPTNNAPTPTRPAGSVLAMFDSSGVYPEAPVDDWDASWGSAEETLFTIPASTNAVLKYYSLQYAGVEFYSPDQIDVSAYNTMHVDVWTLNANQLGIELVSLDNGTQPALVNFLPSSGTIVTNQWISLDIPLNEFTAVNSSLDLTALQQLLWIDNQAGGGVTGGTFYIDNIYFYSNSVAPPPVPQPTNNAPTPTHAAGSVLAMYDSSGVYPVAPVDDWCASWSSAVQGLYTIPNTSDAVLQYGALLYAGVDFEDPNQIDASGYNMMHFDVWTPDANQFGLQLVSLDNGGTQAGQVNFLAAGGGIVSNQWISLNIPLSEFTAAANQVDAATLDLSNLEQLLWIDNQGGGVTGGIFYIDNVYFYNGVVPSQPAIGVSEVNGNIQLSFSTQTSMNYTVQYKTNLADAVWRTLTTKTGNGSAQLAADSASQTTRFYRIWVH
ncbi:MAG: hypothetical protein ABSA83_00410 [Verrucomicrobiota bacterium]|jgi:hypothetical protein